MNEIQKDKGEKGKIIREKQESCTKKTHLKLSKQKEMSKKLEFFK